MRVSMAAVRSRSPPMPSCATIGFSCAPWSATRTAAACCATRRTDRPINPKHWVSASHKRCSRAAPKRYSTKSMVVSDAPDTDAPLAGVGVLIILPAHQAAHLAQLIEQAGGVAIRFPTIEIVPPVDLDPLLAISGRL